MKVLILLRQFAMRFAFRSLTVPGLSPLLFIGAGFAQTPGTGAITGTVDDPSGRVVVGAEVDAVNEATHASRVVMTNAEGVFRVPLLPPGSYSVMVKASGFTDNSSRSIQVTVSETTSLNVMLAVAGSSAHAEVSADAEMVDTESST